jgi:sugar lactone lactonase YvrE
VQRHLAVRATVVVAAVSLLTAMLTTPAAAARAPATAAGSLFPTTISLPDGFAPEGIAIGNGPFAYFGSRADGSIYRANLVTGSGRIISPPTGTMSLGLKADHRGRLFVAGGSSGDARVIDVHTGAVLAHYQFATGPSFVNDVVLTPDAAWFTDSTNAFLYKLPLGPGGRLPTAGEVVRVPLSGDIKWTPGAINANGIVRTPDGRALIIVQTNTGLLFRVNPATGVTSRIDLGAKSVPNGDGLLVLGRTLYVVQNIPNKVAVIRLDRAGRSGALLDRLKDPRFDTPTTVAAFGDRLYLPNARFLTPVTPTTEYTAVAIPRHS